MKEKQAKIVKTVGLITLAILLVLLAIGAFIKIYFNQIASYGVKKFLSNIIGVPVELKGASFSLTKGDLSLKGFVLGNPPGYQTDSSLKSEQLHVKINLLSLLRETIVIDEILIQGIQITYEAGTPSNLGKIKENISSNSKRRDSPKETAKREKKVHIKKIVIKEVEIRVSIKGLGGRAITLKMPDLIITDVGKESQGITIEESVDQILSSIFDSAIRFVEEGGGFLKESIKEVKEKILNLFN